MCAMEEINKPDLKGFEKHSGDKANNISAKNVDNQNPELIVGSSRGRKLFITIISLVMALVLATVIFAVFLPRPSSPNDIFITLSADMNIVKIDSDVPEGTDIKLMPGDSLNSKFKVASAGTDEFSKAEVFIRVKIYAIVDENYYDNLFTFDTASEEWLNNWMVAADGYVYLRKVLVANTSIEFASKLTLDKNIGNDMQGRQIQLVFLAEALQAGEDGQQAIASIWETAPQTWRDEIISNSNN